MCYGFSGSSSLKSKADALKYAIEFTSTGEYPNRVPDMAKAKELFDFICENVQLPDVETDQLSNSLNGFTSMMERLSEKKEETAGEEDKKGEDEISCAEIGAMYNSMKSYCKALGLKPYMTQGGNRCAKESFRIKGDGAHLTVWIERGVQPQPGNEY
jgi:hypothetical protein